MDLFRRNEKVVITMLKFSKKCPLKFALLLVINVIAFSDAVIAFNSFECSWLKTKAHDWFKQGRVFHDRNIDFWFEDKNVIDNKYKNETRTLDFYLSSANYMANIYQIFCNETEKKRIEQHEFENVQRIKLDKIIEKLDSTESLDQIIAELDVLKQKHYRPPAQELKSLVELIELNDMRFQKILEKLNPSELEKINSRRLKKLFDRLKIPVD